MKRKSLLILVLFIFLVLLSGCSAGGSFVSQNVTNVELSKSNFNIVAKNVEGTSKASYILGVTFSDGGMSNTVAVARVDGSAKLYDDAIQNLWKNFEEEHGNTEGKKFVLANIRIDNDMLNLLLYTKTQIFITADVIEFVEE